MPPAVRRVTRRLIAALSLTSVAGCFPALTHGARVEDGWIAGVMAGSTSGDTHVEGDEGGIHLRQAVIGPFVGHGSAPARPTQPGYYIGLAVPVFFPLAQVDAYLQLPPAWTSHFATGLGGTASLESAHGYAMVGGDFDRARSWYVAGGYGSRQSSSQFQSASPAWFANGGIIIAYGYLRTQLFAQFAAGRIPGSCFTDPTTHADVCDRGEHGRALSFGLALGRQQHNARERGFTPAPLPALPFVADTAHAEIVTREVVRRYVHSPTGPWAIHVLEVDLDRCVAAVAVKDADSAAGRIKTSTMLGDLAKRVPVIAGVNADFFSLANGTPVNLLVVDGRMFTPPVAQPALAFDSSGTPHIATFHVSGTTLAPFYPIEAVGGRPALLRDSVVLGEVDTEGQASFNVGRNPRTAAGLARKGRRLILVVVDGRQMPHSDGMSLRELANLMLALGARDAINLDGGGSSTLVYADPTSGGALKIANRPSDKEGERAVGDALAIVRRC